MYLLMVDKADYTFYTKDRDLGKKKSETNFCAMVSDNELNVD
jgi:hypothetical protein